MEIPDIVVRTISTELRHPSGLLQAGYLVGRIEGDVILVRSVIIPQQRVERGSTVIDAVALSAAREEIEASGKQIVGMATHHHEFAAYESATTAKTIHQLVATLGHACVSLVVNNGGEFYHALHEVPPPTRGDQLPTDV